MIAAATIAILQEIANTGATTGQHGTLRAATPQAANIEWLYWFIFWVVLAAFVLTIAAFARSTIKNRVSPREIVPVFEDKEGDKRAVWGVAIAVAITVIMLFIVLGFSITTGKTVEALSSPQPVTIDVTGHQWWWEVKYPGSEPDLTITTANEIHVPVGVPVVVLTHSADVIHSFWAPSINGKRDLLPGYSSAFWFKVDNPGIYRGQCAEFCGLQHAHMGFSIIAESKYAFKQWQQDQLQDAHQPDTPEETRGREVFLTHACLMCHTIHGTDAASNVGPDLTHVASRSMIAAETLPNTTGALAGWIIDPQRIKPGTQMAPNALSPDDLQALLAYLESLK